MCINKRGLRMGIYPGRDSAAASGLLARKAETLPVSS